MKQIWKQCWEEFIVWFEEQWKFAWDILRESIVGLTLAVFAWLKTIFGGVLAGLWKLVIKPVGKWCCDKFVEWIKKI